MEYLSTSTLPRGEQVLMLMMLSICYVSYQEKVEVASAIFWGQIGRYGQKLSKVCAQSGFLALG